METDPGTNIAGRLVPTSTDVSVEVDYWARRVVLKFPAGPDGAFERGARLVFPEVIELTGWRETPLVWGELFSVKHQDASELFERRPSGALRRIGGTFNGMIADGTGNPVLVTFDGQAFSLDFVYCGAPQWEDGPFPTEATQS